MFRPPGDCPVCGEFVPKGSYACTHCSADDRSGWKEDDSYDGLNLPDEEFNYDEFLKNEFGDSEISNKLHPLWSVTGIILLILSIIGILIWAAGN
jgi:hypothetical protein